MEALQDIIRLVDDDGSGANSYDRVQVNLIGVFVHDRFNALAADV